MARPPLEVADLIRSVGAAFVERNRHWLSWKHIKVLLAIARCRTAALGGYLDECTRCGHRATISYNSCRNRHCPKCQTAARERWIAARQRELLPTRYVHVVFTFPPQLAPLALQNKKVIYDLLFRASAETLLEVACDPKHLGADIGFFTVLHPNYPNALHDKVHQRDRKRLRVGSHCDEPAVWPQPLNAVHHRFGRIGSTEDHVCATRCGKALSVAHNFIRAEIVDHLVFIGGVRNRDGLEARSLRVLHR